MLKFDGLMEEHSISIMVYTNFIAMKWLILIFTLTIPFEMKAQLTYLALGDSYTIGEAVPAEGNFPNQIVNMLRAKGMEISDAEIIAKTGWTTFELMAHLEQHPPQKTTYDFVTLLIGVNNQYRGLSSEAYAKDFEMLLNKAIQYAGGKKERVIVVSIPDWGVTPFAAGRDTEKIRKEIDLFNNINRSISEAYQIHYVDITPFTREALIDRSLLAEDGLHPGAKDYSRWAEVISSWMWKSQKE
jgi:lysophospholipase L1-like esterase